MKSGLAPVARRQRLMRGRRIVEWGVVLCLLFATPHSPLLICHSLLSPHALDCVPLFLQFGNNDVTVIALNLNNAIAHCAAAAAFAL